MSDSETTEREFTDEDIRPLLELRRLAGGRCCDCLVAYDPFEVVFSVAMGFKTAPRCFPCLARGFGRPANAFRKELTEYVQRRECYLRAWREAERMTSSPDSTVRVAAVESVAVPSLVPENRWDAGDMGCGDLVMGLRLKLNALASGSVLAVRATDPAAPEDLPSWCRLTGHTMVTANHPDYLIRRK